MACFQCKSCGGTMKVLDGTNVAECEYCLLKQTLPRYTNDNVAALYERAGHFRRNNDFDKAAKIYEQILEQDSTDAEAYWSLVLCCYGVEYVEDPKTQRRMITVNRIQHTSVYDDENYKSALRYSDVVSREVYQAEAEEINNIQKNFLQISQKEEPFDIFICYKETDENGRRTPDSVLAQELYKELTELGYKVFFARITLEDKLGTAYEPYIFAALDSSKVMVALGTKPEYFQAVWVKNEWSRYLAMIRKGAKKMLIPAYRDMDPYYLPEEFSHLQAQDMSKLGFMQDLVHGIQKLVGNNQPAPTAAPAPSSEVAPLLRRIELFLTDGMFQDAKSYCEKVLDKEPENGQAYVYQLLAQLQVNSLPQLKNYPDAFDHLPSYKNAVRFAAADVAEELIGYNRSIRNRNQSNQWWNQTASQQINQQQDLIRKQQQEIFLQQRMERQAEIDKLTQKRKKRIGWCIFWFIVYAPIGIIQLIRVLTINSKIKKLEKEL